MGLNWFVLPLPDIAVRVIGVTVLIDLFVLIYSRVKLKNNKAS
jgi:preprotein translocase subunit SecD